MTTMRLNATLLLSVACAATALAACAGPRAPTPGAGSTSSGASDSSSARKPSTLTIAIGGEVDGLATKLGGGIAADLNSVPNSPLIALNGDGAVVPLLAAESPSRDTGAWLVRPDGTMATTWKIRPNAKWHDGRDVVSEDFVFALKVYLDDTIPIRVREPERLMAWIEPLDGKTFVVEWARPYPWANQLGPGELEPLPEHLLRRSYESMDAEAFLHAWSTGEYVGTGPYRLVQWQPGSQLVFRAFDAYFMGRPRIDELIFQVIGDQNTVVANLLSGEVDATARNTLDLQAAHTIRTRWGETGGGRVLITHERFRFAHVQQEPAYLAGPSLSDVRVRRAIVHGLDRPALAEVVTAGTAPATEIFVPPNDPLHSQAQQAARKYPHDPRAATALLEEVGWTRRGDALVDSRGQPFTLDLRFLQGTANETEASIMGADLSKLGMQVSQTLIPKSLNRDNEYRAKFPGLTQSARPIKVPAIMGDWISDQCPDPRRRYSGANRGCWKNPEYDRLYVTATTALDSAARANAILDGIRIWTEEVGLFGLRYDPENIAVRKGLVGPAPYWPAQAVSTWNIHEWRWE